MHVVSDPTELRQTIAGAGPNQGSVGLVPTMGALHAGHTALADRARHENDVVVMSIFVNPTQFGEGEDFSRYPRDLARDRDIAQHAGVDVLFVPSNQTMYPGPQRVWIDPGPLATYLEGARRPGHFAGVCTVVAKLFHLVQPDRAYFGQKDGQQARIVQAMVKDLAFPPEIRIVPTVRETDGLALSSRNVYLSVAERRQAPAIAHALQAATESLRSGQRDPQALERLITENIQMEAPLGAIDYVECTDLETLEPLTEPIARDALLSVAVFFGQTRLIDNLVARFDSDGRYLG